MRSDPSVIAHSRVIPLRCGRLRLKAFDAVTQYSSGARARPCSGFCSIHFLKFHAGQNALRHGTRRDKGTAECLKQACQRKPFKPQCLFSWFAGNAATEDMLRVSSPGCDGSFRHSVGSGLPQNKHWRFAAKAELLFSWQESAFKVPCSTRLHALSLLHYSASIICLRLTIARKTSLLTLSNFHLVITA